MKITKKKFSFKQKSLINFYKIQQLLIYKSDLIKLKIKVFFNSSYFYIVCFGIVICLIHTLNINPSVESIKNFSLAISGIIGGSIAIIFSFSLFILQSSAELFSTQYLNRFVNSSKEKVIFWILVFSTILSLLTPFIFTEIVLEILISIFLLSFYFIFYLFKELRKRINPEYTLEKIKKESFSILNKINSQFKKQSDITSRIYEYDKSSKDMNLDIQYKLNSSWSLVIMENFKQLFEIGFRLLSKNEINSFNLSVKYIHDIYLEHLRLRDGYFIRKPYDFFGTYIFDDEGFTTSVLEYLQSISDRLIQEKRKENIYYLLKIYENIIVTAIEVKYADDTYHSKGNPLASLALGYYIGFLEKVVDSKENDWIWETIKSLSRISNTITQKTSDDFLNEQIYKILNKILLWSIKEEKESHLKELVNIYFYKINFSWNKDRHSQIYWNDLFKELKKGILSLAYTEKRFSMSTSNLFSDFDVWKTNLINHILKIKKKKKQKENLDNFIQLLEKWSDFLLDFARDTGLENKQTGLPIIQSIDNNLNIIYGIKNKVKNIKLEKLYNTQFNILSWYFQKIDKVDESFLFNLEEVLEILLREIRDNLKNKTFTTEQLLDLYIRLIEQHFEKVNFGHGYNHPRVIEKLVYLGLLLHKYKKIQQEKNIVSKIEELNKKYLELNKGYFKLKKKVENLMGPDEFQLCEEIHNLKEELFLHCNNSLMDIKALLKEEITKDEWDKFIEKIKHCKNIEYETNLSGMSGGR